ncbi:hypothetical protein P9112_009052 [Eukaryota sp. TZLM1-RC]
MSVPLSVLHQRIASKLRVDVHTLFTQLQAADTTEQQVSQFKHFLTNAKTITAPLYYLCTNYSPQKSAELSSRSQRLAMFMDQLLSAPDCLFQVKNNHRSIRSTFHDVDCSLQLLMNPSLPPPFPTCLRPKPVPEKSLVGKEEAKLLFWLESAVAATSQVAKLKISFDLPGIFLTFVDYFVVLLTLDIRKSTSTSLLPFLDPVIEKFKTQAQKPENLIVSWKISGVKFIFEPTTKFSVSQAKFLFKKIQASLDTSPLSSFQNIVKILLPVAKAGIFSVILDQLNNHLKGQNIYGLYDVTFDPQVADFSRKRRHSDQSITEGVVIKYWKGKTVFSISIISKNNSFEIIHHPKHLKELNLKVDLHPINALKIVEDTLNFRKDYLISKLSTMDFFSLVNNSLFLNIGNFHILIEFLLNTGKFEVAINDFEVGYDFHFRIKHKITPILDQLTYSLHLSDLIVSEFEQKMRQVVNSLACELYLSEFHQILNTRIDWIVDYADDPFFVSLTYPQCQYLKIKLKISGLSVDPFLTCVLNEFDLVHHFNINPNFENLILSSTPDAIIQSINDWILSVPSFLISYALNLFTLLPSSCTITSFEQKHFLISKIPFLNADLYELNSKSSLVLERNHFSIEIPLSFSIQNMPENFIFENLNFSIGFKNNSSCLIVSGLVNCRVFLQIACVCYLLTLFSQIHESVEIYDVDYDVKFTPDSSLIVSNSVRDSFVLYLDSNLLSYNDLIYGNLKKALFCDLYNKIFNDYYLQIQRITRKTLSSKPVVVFINSLFSFISSFRSLAKVPMELYLNSFGSFNLIAPKFCLKVTSTISNTFFVDYIAPTVELSSRSSMSLITYEAFIEAFKRVRGICIVDKEDSNDKFVSFSFDSISAFIQVLKKLI